MQQICWSRAPECVLTWEAVGAVATAAAALATVVAVWVALRAARRDRERQRVDAESRRVTLRLELYEPLVQWHQNVSRAFYALQDNEFEFTLSGAQRGEEWPVRGASPLAAPVEIRRRLRELRDLGPEALPLAGAIHREGPAVEAHNVFVDLLMDHSGDGMMLPVCRDNAIEQIAPLEDALRKARDIMREALEGNLANQFGPPSSARWVRPW